MSRVKMKIMVIVALTFFSIMAQAQDDRVSLYSPSGLRLFTESWDGTGSSLRAYITLDGDKSGTRFYRDVIGMLYYDERGKEYMSRKQFEAGKAAYRAMNRGSGGGIRSAGAIIVGTLAAVASDKPMAAPAVVTQHKSAASLAPASTPASSPGSARPANLEEWAKSVHSTK